MKLETENFFILFPLYNFKVNIISNDISSHSSNIDRMFQPEHPETPISFYNYMTYAKCFRLKLFSLEIT